MVIYIKSGTKDPCEYVDVFMVREFSIEAQRWFCMGLKLRRNFGRPAFRVPSNSTAGSSRSFLYSFRGFFVRGILFRVPGTQLCGRMLGSLRIGRGVFPNVDDPNS